MTGQQIYDLAEWLLYNHESVKSLLKPQLTKALSQMMFDGKIYWENQVMYKVLEYHPKMKLEDIEEAFADERVRIILDRYYFKDFYYEH
jgi:hypothetical protein